MATTSTAISEASRTSTGIPAVAPTMIRADQRDEGPDHEDVAMGEIDHSDDAVDHRVADGDQAVDRTERQPVDQLLYEILHMPLVPCGCDQAVVPASIERLSSWLSRVAKTTGMHCPGRACRAGFAPFGRHLAWCDKVSQMRPPVRARLWPGTVAIPGRDGAGRRKAGAGWRALGQAEQTLGNKPCATGGSGRPGCDSAGKISNVAGDGALYRRSDNAGHSFALWGKTGATGEPDGGEHA